MKDGRKEEENRQERHARMLLREKTPEIISEGKGYHCRPYDDRPNRKRRAEKGCHQTAGAYFHPITAMPEKKATTRE